MTVATLVEGAAVVKVYRHKNRGKFIHAIHYYRFGKPVRVHRMLEADAMRVAKDALTLLKSDAPKSLSLGSMDDVRAACEANRTRRSLCDVALDYSTCVAVLGGHERVLEACRFYAEKVIGAGCPSISVKEAVDITISAKAASHTKRYISSLKTRLKAFAEEFGTERLASLTEEKIEAFIRRQKWSEKTRSGVRAYILIMVNHCKAAGYLPPLFLFELAGHLRVAIPDMLPKYVPPVSRAEKRLFQMAALASKLA